MNNLTEGLFADISLDCAVLKDFDKVIKVMLTQAVSAEMLAFYLL